MTHPRRLVSAPTYWRCEPAWSWTARPLPDHLLWCVLDGVGRLTLDDRSCDLGPGMCAVFAPGDEPRAEHDPQRRLLVFGMHFEASPAGPVVPPGTWCQVREPDLLAALARRSDTSYRRGDALGSRQALLCLEQILCILWEDSLHPATSPTDSALEEVARTIREDPSRRWTVAELAGRTALSRAQFTRRFTAYAGMPPGRYAVRARITRARELLATTTMSVTQVAATLGYPDVASFSRQYKWHTGGSPGRRRHQPP